MEATYRTGQVIWRELLCPDVNKARGFYGELFGWTFSEMPMPGGVYTIANVGGNGVAGIVSPPPGTPAPTCWTPYVSVMDNAAAEKAATANGGNVLMASEAIPGMLTFGVITDSSGAAIGLMHSHDGDRPGPEKPPLGSFCWETLNTNDIEKARAFYPPVLGWTGGDGPNNMLVFSAGKVQIADVEAAPPGVPPHWLSHVLVEKLEASRTRAEKLGATILMPVVDIPHVGRICVLQDPAGAVLSLFEPAAAAS